MPFLLSLHRTATLERREEEAMLKDEVLALPVTEETTGSSRVSARFSSTSLRPSLKQRAESTEQFEGEFQEGNRLCLVHLPLLLVLLD
jgi:hypothetical protein